MKAILEKFKGKVYMVILAVFVPIIISLVSVRSSTLSDLQQRSLDASKKMSQISRELNEGKNFELQLTECYEAIAKFERRMVRASDLADNLQYYYRLFPSLESKIQGLKSDGSVVRSSNQYNIESFSFSISADFYDLNKFIQVLNSGDKFTELSEVSFSKSSGAVGSDRSISMIVKCNMLSIK